MTWDESSGVVSVDHQGRRLLDIEELGVGNGSVDIAFEAGAYRFSDETESIERGVALDVRSRPDSPLWLAEILDETGASIATLSASGFGGGLLRLELLSIDATDDRTRFGFDCHGEDTFLGGGAYGRDVEHGGTAFDLWVGEPGAGGMGDDGDGSAVGRHRSSHPSPFLIRPHEPVGVAIDTAARVGVDLCARDPDRWTLTADSGRVGLVVLPGPTPLDVVERHGLLTGPPLVPPDWAFAPWVDAPEGQEEVERVAAGLREAEVPSSVIRSLDWGGEGATGWTLDEQAFPAIEDLTSALEADGFRWIVSFSPFLDDQDAVWDEGRNHTITTSEGEIYWMARADGSTTTVIDATEPDAIAWAQDRMVEALSLGAAGWMQDSGEWVPPDALFHQLDPIAQHNIHPSMWHQVGSDVVDGRDALISTRSGWSGNGADAAIAGTPARRPGFGSADGYPSVLAMGIGTSLAGAPFFAHDIGGDPAFGDGSGARESWFRWCSLGAFTPIMRTGPRRGTEDDWHPARDAETLAHFARYGREHVALFPYLRGLADLAVTEGRPLLLPPAMRYGGDWERTDAWLLGDALLVAPVLEEAVEGRDVELPPDVDWYDYWTSEPVSSGFFEADETEIPVFVAEGTVVPTLTQVPQTLVAGDVQGAVSLADIDHLRTLRVFGRGGQFEEADGTRYRVVGTPVHQDKQTVTLDTGVVEVGGARLEIDGSTTRTYTIVVVP